MDLNKFISGVPIVLPTDELAKVNGWKYQMQWDDNGTLNIMRFKTIYEARSGFKMLTDEGLCPFVVDIFTGKMVKIHTK